MPEVVLKMISSILKCIERFMMGSLRSYSSALSNSAIHSNYAATAARFDIQQLEAPASLMWLRADAVQGLSDGASVSTWKDMSGNGYNATQSTAANQPAWKRNILNGYPALRFNGTSSYLLESPVFPVNSGYLW